MSCHLWSKRGRHAFARSVPLIFISPEVNEFITWFNTALFLFFPLPLICSTLPVKSLNNLFLDHLCVDRPAAFECNLNNILYVFSVAFFIRLRHSVLPSELSITGPQGVVDTCSLKHSERRGESRGESGCGKNMPLNTMYSTENRGP